MAKLKVLRVRLIRKLAVWLTVLSVLLLFFYSPFYSKMILFLLNKFVPVEVNKVAAQSQKMAALTEHDDLEPGSNLWIARQAYFHVLEQAMQSDKPQDLVAIQARYVLLQQHIQDEQSDQPEPKKKITPPLNPALQQEQQTMLALLDLNRSEHKKLMDRYVVFLQKKPRKPNAKKDQEKQEQQKSKQPTAVPEDIVKDMQQIRAARLDPKKPLPNQPNAIVVLGGGLTQVKNQKTIVVNDYTRLRLEKTWDIEQRYHLPIVLSGVEAPYMQKWLAVRGVTANLLENRSMNTCENSRFSSLLLQKKGGAPTVILVTDMYHMPRTRRLFALNGIETIPVESAMPTPLTSWQPSLSNYHHSRRANYELLATIRDMLLGSSGCREVP